MTLLMEQAAALDTSMPDVKLACDGVVAMSYKILSLLGLSVVIVEGRGGKVFMFCRVHVIG